MPDQTVTNTNDPLNPGQPPADQTQVPQTGVTPEPIPADDSSQTPVADQGQIQGDTQQISDQTSGMATPVSPPPAEPGTDPALNPMDSQSSDTSSTPSQDESVSEATGDKPAEDEKSEPAQPPAQTANIPPVSDSVAPPVGGVVEPGQEEAEQAGQASDPVGGSVPMTDTQLSGDAQTTDASVPSSTDTSTLPQEPVQNQSMPTAPDNVQQDSTKAQDDPDDLKKNTNP